MITADQIIALVDAVVAADHPDAVVLFGSYAYGTPTADSDVDLLVVRDYQGASPYRAAAIEAELGGLAFPIDLIVRSRTEIATRVSMNDWFLREITERGITLYAADDLRVGEQGRLRLWRHLRVVTGGTEHAPVGADLLPRPAVR